MNWIQLFQRYEELGNKMRREDIGKDLFYFVAFVNCKTAGAMNLKLGSLVSEPNQNRRKLIQYL